MFVKGNRKAHLSGPLLNQIKDISTKRKIFKILYFEIFLNLANLFYQMFIQDENSNWK